MSAVLSQTLPLQSIPEAHPNVQLPTINCVVFAVNGELVLEASSAQELSRLSKAACPKDAVLVNDAPLTSRRMFFSNECGQAYGLIRTMLRSLQVSEADIRQIASLLPAESIQPELLDPRHRLQLTSRDLLSAPGLVNWAKAGYATEISRGGHVGPFIAVLADGYDLGPILAEKVLRGEISVVEDGICAVLLLDDEQLRCYVTRRADLQCRPGKADLVI
ncbi:MAG: hypothetical protein EKK47_20145 [Burkholderiales bacterium]|nr:MAG: hypothetical protein EKK47_20145 [Burkholderiales bacterium]